MVLFYSINMFILVSETARITSICDLWEGKIGPHIPDDMQVSYVQAGQCVRFVRYISILCTFVALSGGVYETHFFIVRRTFF